MPWISCSAPKTWRSATRCGAFLADNVTPDMRRAIDLTTGFLVEPDVLIDFHRALHRKGWSVPHWPVEYGGTGWTPVQRYVFDLECGRAGASTYNASGSHFVGPVIIRYGTPAQKDKYLPGIRSGEDYWAQGYSEPGSGSDLASLKTRAEFGRRHLRHQRPEDLDHARAPREPHLRAGAHVERRQAPGRHHLPADRHGHARRHACDRSSATAAITNSTRCSSTTRGCRRTTASARRTRAGRSRSTCSSSSAAAACWRARCARNSPSSCS